MGPDHDYIIDVSDPKVRFFFTSLCYKCDVEWEHDKEEGHDVAEEHDVETRGASCGGGA